MKKTKLLFIIFTVSLLVFFSCSEDNTGSDTEAPTVVITYPADNSEFTIGSVISIIAEADDNEEIKEVRFFIDGSNVSIDETEPYKYEWDTGETRDTDHTIYAKAYDTSDNSTTSGVITVTLTEDIGNPPNPPSNPNPVNTATSVSLITDLSWNCTDPDGDPLTYDVYFGTSSNPPLANSGQSETTYDPGTLIEETAYYWKITAHDDHSNSTTGDIWEFTTIVNLAPYQPNNPSPNNSATSVYTNRRLIWSCTDPENDPLTYDVYFGSSSNPPLIQSGLDENIYHPGIMNPSTTYFWKITAQDDHSNSTEGDIWQFTTFEPSFVTDIDGNTYQTIMIGDQEWMMENLKTTHYRNGDQIPNVTDNNEWVNLSSGAYCVYSNNPSNAEIYGNLFNWYAVNDSRGLAPEGWHVATDDEIKQLEMYLGMSASQVNNIGDRGTNEGSKLAGREDLWANGVILSNPEFGSSGFNFLPGGWRYDDDGTFGYLIMASIFWSSSEGSGNEAWVRRLIYFQAGVNRNDVHKGHGFSVRCVRD